MEILTHPNPVLKQQAEKVDPASDSELRTLVAQMVKLMREAPGVGLAAPQIGVQKRVIVIEIDDKLFALCNPQLVDPTESTELEEEGCLSVPGITVPVERYLGVTCEAHDIEGNPVRIEASGLLARVLQHETDHLDGVLIVDRAAPEDRKAALRRYNEVMPER